MKKYYDKEAIARANDYDLADLLRAAGYNLVQCERDTFCLKEHDSLKISRHKGWMWFSQGVGGKNIDFFSQYEGLDFVSAVERIFEIANDKTYAAVSSESTFEEKKEKSVEETKPFVLPAENENCKRAFNYLVHTRGISEKLVALLISSGHVYESVKHNVVFCGTDFENNIVSAHERGTGSTKYVRDVSGSDKSYRFRITSQTADKVNVFESEIDLLSYITLTGLKKENYIALGGCSNRKTLEAFLADRCIDNINLCLDNDEAGRTACERYKKIYGDKYNVTVDLPKERKDWNDVLTSYMTEVMII